MRGTGYSLQPTVIMVVCICIVRVLWIWFVVSRFHTIVMLCMIFPITWVLCASIFFALYLKGDWLHNRIAALGMAPEVR